MSHLKSSRLPKRCSGKEPACNAGDTRDAGSVPRSGRSPGEVNGNPPQYSCLENSMDNGTWWTIVQGVSKSWTRLSDEHFKSFVSLLIFHLDNLSIDISGVLKVPCYYCVNINFSLCVVSICFVFRCSYVGHIYIYNCYVFLLN